VERRLAAIVAADLVGYSKLMGEDEAGTLSALSRLTKDLIEPLITEHHGRIVKLMGMAFWPSLQVWLTRSRAQLPGRNVLPHQATAFGSE